MKICSKKSCNELGIHPIGSSQYCDRCFRFQSMRYQAKANNKYIPSFQELNELLLIIGDKLLCPNCHIPMVWKSKRNNVGRTMSLQHNNDSTMSLICVSCNVAHRNSKLGDRYFDIPEDHKYCSRCNMTLNKTEFNKNKNRINSLRAYCKKCNIIYDKSFYKNVRKNHGNN